MHCDSCGTACGQALSLESGAANPTVKISRVQPEIHCALGVQKAKDTAEARLLQDFLEGTSNQLTYPGLEGLHKGLRQNELAVFFRNNHFNTIFLHQGSLHILVTDMGYLAHPVRLPGQLPFDPQAQMSLQLGSCQPQLAVLLCTS